MLFDLDNQYIKSHLGEAEFGIERESLRVTSSGALAQTKHPFGEHRNIDRDFCENQVLRNSFSRFRMRSTRSL